MTSLSRAARSAHESWVEQGLARHIAAFGSPQVPHADIDGRNYLQLSSSDYLGLSTDPRMIHAAQQAIAELGTGSGGSRLTTGTSIHAALEAELAEHFGYEAAVWFATGYQANLSTISTLATLAGSDLTIFSDELNHASIIDGIRLARQLTGCVLRVFPHADYTALCSLLATCDTRHALIISDGVFSMSGAIADHRALERIARAYDAWLLIDDAHGIGVLGHQGRGSCDGLSHPDVLIGTASKALGCAGGFALCDNHTATFLRNRARSFVFSTSSPPSTIAAARTAVRILRDDPSVQRRLGDVIAWLREGLTEQGFDCSGTSAIIPVPIGDERVATRVSERLRDHGIYCNAIRYPTVPRGKAILRLTAQARMTREDVEQLLTALAHCLT